MQVLVQVRPTFHELYGYSLNVLDIDPTYTLGDLARRRKEILRMLHEEGIDQMNKELPLPQLLQRIAVISSVTAAGYGDFKNQLETNDKHLAFYTKLFPATMQGDGVEQSVIQALNAIAREQEQWDAVVIIRGGGSTSDLSGFDTLLLAENVAQFPLPVITGIGHEREDTVIDMIAHTRVKTPTAAAEWLIHHQEEQLNIIGDISDRLLHATRDSLLQATTRLQAQATRLPALIMTRVSQEQTRMARLQNMMQLSAMQIFTRCHTMNELMQHRLQTATSAVFQQQRTAITLLQSNIQAADPIHVLQLGYSITRLNGRAIKAPSQVKSGDIIETTLLSGTVLSRIEESKN